MSLKRSQVDVSQFSIGEEAEGGEGVLVGVLREEERVNELKRKLIYQEDYDLELLYERRGADFQHLLNNRYGTCNFTSFVRYLVPGDFEHRYLAFIKYQKLNTLSEDTLGMVDQLLEEERRQEDQIEQWWAGVDREVVFRGYCRPGDKGIPTQEVWILLCRCGSTSANASARSSSTGSTPVRPASYPTRTSTDDATSVLFLIVTIGKGIA